jgi:hypothetical protein
MFFRDLVTSFELSLVLKRIGVEQDSVFWWHQGKVKTNDDLSEIMENYLGVMNNSSSAFLADELAEKLPPFIGAFRLTCGMDKFGVWHVYYKRKKDHKGSRLLGKLKMMTSDELLSNAFAKMLIYLYENKIYPFAKQYDPKEKRTKPIEVS